MHRRTFLMTATAASGAALLSAVTALPAQAASQSSTSVSSLTALQAAITAAVPGTVIVVANGSYAVPDNAPILVSGKSGSAASPITIVAASRNGVIFTGSRSFVFAGSKHIVISGFVLTQSTTLEIPADCSNIRITRTDFQFADVEGLHWVMVRADNSKIDRNYFHGKTTLGIYLGVEGAGSSAMAQNVHILRNYFADHHFAGANGGEPIRLGVSPRALSSANALVEYNLFERANGDPEAISVKSSDNVIRYNTIRSSAGGIVLRHGNRNRVDGNYLVDGASGIRLYGNDHVIVNNYVANIAGSGVLIGAGTERDHVPGESAEARRGNDAADRVLIALNTIWNTDGGIIGETHRPHEPRDLVISDNVIVSDRGLLASVPASQGFSWSGNILFGAAPDGDIPVTGFRRLDPKLVASADGVYRLAATSPAINAALGGYPAEPEDLDGHARTAPADVGADEYSTAAPIRRPLTPADVGPASA